MSTVITKLLVAASLMIIPAADGEGPDGGRLLWDGSPPPSALFDAKGEFQFFVPGVPVGPRQPEPNLVVGFIDSGTTSSHPQLAGLVLEERTFVDGPVRDELGHGTWAMLVTFVVAPQKRFGFYSAKVTRDGTDLRAANVIAAFNWLVSKGVPVINISLGFDRLTPDVQRLCQVIAQQESVIVAAAAGNEGPDVKVYPAHCGAKNVIAVGEVLQGKPTPSSGRGDVYAQPPKFLSRWAFLNERAGEEMRAGRLDAAKSLFEQSLAVTENAEALHGLALVSIRRGDWQAARGFAERVIALVPDASEPYQTLGAVLLSLNDAVGAIPKFERALELDPKNQRALLNLARACIASGDFHRAGDVLDRAKANDPSDQRVGEVRSLLIERSGGRP